MLVCEAGLDVILKKIGTKFIKDSIYILLFYLYERKRMENIDIHIQKPKKESVDIFHTTYGINVKRQAVFELYFLLYNNNNVRL